MIYAGITSITFRKFDPDEIIRMAAEAGLDAIEWGGDIHVPHGQTDTADKVGKATRDAGLTVSSYGSYYRAGVSESKGLTFSSVLDTTEALGAPLVRIWAGNKGSHEVSADERRRITEECCRIGDMAAERDLRAGLEYHEGSLTDTPESTAQLLEETDGHNIETLWQPRGGDDIRTSVSALRQVVHKLANLHVFYWWPDRQDRRPLAEGRDHWKAFLNVVTDEAPAITRYALIEFVKDDSAEMFYEDAQCLRSLLKEERERQA